MRIAVAATGLDIDAMRKNASYAIGFFVDEAMVPRAVS
jgi:hypothetical protein